MKKQTKQLAALAGVLAIGIGVYAALRLWNSGAEEREAAAADYVVKLENIQSLSFQNEHGAFAFSNSEDGWSFTDDAEFPVDGTYLDAITEALAGLKAERILSAPDELADYGLTEPAYTLTAVTAAGDTVTLLLGNSDAGGSNRYAKLEGADTVYTVGSTLEALIDHDLLELMQLPALPDMGQSSVKAVTVETPAVSHRLTKTTVSRDQTVETDTGEVDENGNAIYESKTETVTTTTWYADGQEIPSDAQALSDWFTALSGLTLQACYAYQADADTLAACGLLGGSTLTVTLSEENHSEGETVTLGFGASEGDADTCYVTLGAPVEGCNIYLVSLETAQTLLALSGETLSASETVE